jgi:signal transduction histidine kinase
MRSTSVRRALILLTAAVAGSALVAVHLTSPGRLLIVLDVAVAAAVAQSVALVRVRARQQKQLRDMYAAMKQASPSPDLQSMLTMVARRAADVLGANDGVVMIRHGDDLRTYSGIRQGVEPIANAIGTQAFVADQALPSVRVITTGRPLAIADVDSYDGPPGFHDACRIAGIRSVLCIPIHSWDRTSGVLNLGYKQPRRFNDHDLEIASLYAEQAASALEHSLAFELEQDARRAMRELQDLKADFIASLGQELQTPLTSITGFADVLNEHWEALANDERREFAARIAAQGKTLSSLVDDLLEMRGLGSRPIGRLEPLDLRLLVLGTIGRLLDDLREHSVVMDVPENTTVWTRPAAFERVLFSLLTNAVKFSPERSTIRVAAVVKGDDVVISVSDRGIGIAPDDIDLIFERFHRVDTADAAPGGAGIGLPLAKQLVEAMGGRIWATSDMGAGSIFSFSLPAKRAPEPANVMPLRRRAGGSAS